jgi:hypothetical protein
LKTLLVDPLLLLMPCFLTGGRGSPPFYHSVHVSNTGIPLFSPLNKEGASSQKKVMFLVVEVL